MLELHTRPMSKHNDEIALIEAITEKPMAEVERKQFRAKRAEGEKAFLRSRRRVAIVCAVIGGALSIGMAVAVSKGWLLGTDDSVIVISFWEAARNTLILTVGGGLVGAVIGRVMYPL